MQLKGLARGQAQAAVGVLIGQGIQRQPLRGRAHTAGQARADHETVGRLKLLLTALIAHIAIVLLIAAVKLDQHLIVFGKCAGNRVDQAFDQGTAQQATACLDAFDCR